MREGERLCVCVCVCLGEEGLGEKDVYIERNIDRWIYSWTLRERERDIKREREGRVRETTNIGSDRSRSPDLP